MEILVLLVVGAAVVFVAIAILNRLDKPKQDIVTATGETAKATGDTLNAWGGNIGQGFSNLGSWVDEQRRKLQGQTGHAPSVGGGTGGDTPTDAAQPVASATVGLWEWIFGLFGVHGPKNAEKQPTIPGTPNATTGGGGTYHTL